MKILMINSVCGIRSTGRICTDLATVLEEQGHEVKIAYGRETVPEQFQKYAVRIGSDFDVKLHGVKARLFDASGFGSKRVTEKFIEWIKEWNPDVIHLHNIHGYYINIEVLFNYLNTCGKKIFWSFYDCWSFTGHCAHFDLNKCDKWKAVCAGCGYKSDYPKSLISRSKKNFINKKQLFTKIPDFRIVVPSLWMKSIVEQSYMSSYPVSIIPNGINTELFKRRENDFREKHSITPDQFMLLGVSSFWSKEKGIEYFIELSQKLSADKYKVVIIGKLINNTALPPEILYINATNNIDELCEIYSAADVFVNTTLQETQGLTTVEAFACGTPAIVFNTGGAPECVDDTCGIVVEKGNIDALLAAIEMLKEKQLCFNEEACIAKASEYSINRYNKKMIELYQAN